MTYPLFEKLGAAMWNEMLNYNPTWLDISVSVDLARVCLENYKFSMQPIHIQCDSTMKGCVKIVTS